MTHARAYLDWNASAPLRPEAREALIAALDADGNASSVHAEGRRARAVVERAREQVAELVGAAPSEVVFTSGATEANNCVAAAGWNAILLPAIEHPSLLAPAQASGAVIVPIGTDGDGVARVEQVADWVLTGGPRPPRVLMALQAANNETGVIQPVAEVAAFAREHGLAVHVDAVQAIGRVPVSFGDWAADTLSLSGHKIGGPKGVGALVVRDGSTVPAFMKGGGQERRRRAGTEDVAAIAGFGAAATAARSDLAGIDGQRRLRDELENEVRRLTPQAIVIGASVPRLANTSCITLPGHAAETLVIKLDLAGVAVSAGAACSSGKVGASHVLEAMGLSPVIARSAIRVSIGPSTTRREIALFVETWARIAASPPLGHAHSGSPRPLQEV